ncbi:hypothetical protein ACO2Q8_24385 [Larkinella sp. VNQ87]|uniref:hypothetical protein n=1 Tax=Larkinella sp. VNQ87 TaxID=3400921 RepID=UPI003C0135BD
MRTVDFLLSGLKTVRLIRAGFSTVLVSIWAIVSVAAQPSVSLATWRIDVGLSLAKPVWSFGSFHSVGFGIDASATRPVSVLENLYVGGRLNYTHFLARKETAYFFSTGEAANLVSVLGEAHYVHQDKYVIGGNLGLGLRFPSFFGSSGFARAGYIGYQLPVNNRILTVALYLSRTTFATHAFGLRGNIRL